MISRRQLLRHSLALGILPIATIGRRPQWISPSQTPTASHTNLDVFRSPSCDCCGGWVQHMQEAGFTVSETVTDDIDRVKQRHGVTDELASCHTAIAEGYVIEGHVPAEDVRRLLADKPDVTGIAALGMPIGSPGMEMGDEREPYSVWSFKGETIALFAEH